MLDAAIAVFAEKGYAEAKMDEIAERAEFGKGTLYNYFADKRALLFAVIDEVYDEMVALVEEYFAREAEAPRPARDTFRDFIALLVGFFLEREAVFRILMKEAHRLMLEDDGEHREYLYGQRERLVHAIEGPLKEAMRRGMLRQVHAHGVAHLLIGNVYGFLMYACGPSERPTRGQGKPPKTPGEAADFITTVLFDGLLVEKA